MEKQGIKTPGRHCIHVHTLNFVLGHSSLPFLLPPAQPGGFKPEHDIWLGEVDVWVRRCKNVNKKQFLKGSLTKFQLKLLCKQNTGRKHQLSDKQNDLPGALGRGSLVLNRS